MNQDQIKSLLLKIEPDTAEFSVIFSGKNSKKVDGLYHPDSCEIIIHNRNFNNDNSLIYTAIHEFAHHIQFTRHKDQVNSRAHTILFWDIFHRLLNRAETMGLYINIFEADEKFRKLTEKIKTEYLTKNGNLMKDFGKLLIQALDLCQRNHAIFEDYLDRVLGINRTAAKSVMKFYALDIDPELGYDKMKIVAGIKEPEKRMMAVEKFQEGMTQHMIRQELNQNKSEKTLTLNNLLSQKRRIEKSIQSLEERLAEVTGKIENMESAAE